MGKRTGWALENRVVVEFAIDAWAKFTDSTVVEIASTCTLW